MRKSILAAACAAAAISAPASAAVILDAQPFAADDPDAQIHNDGNQSGDGVVTGHTQPGDVNFTFSSPTNLISNGNGHATVSGPWHTLSLAPTDAGVFFESIDFNLNVTCCTGNPASRVPFYADILLTYADGVTTKLFNDVSLANGQNKYLIYGDAGEQFSSIRFTGWRDVPNTVAGNFQDIRQVDVGVVEAGVPEPSTWAMLLLGFGGIGFGMRRRKSERRARLQFA